MPKTARVATCNSFRYAPFSHQGSGDRETDQMSNVLEGRRGVWAFALGVACVTAGVMLHLPMFIAARSVHYQMAGMPMDAGMIVGMVLIVAGVAIAAYGLLPKDLANQIEQSRDIAVSPPEDASLNFAHWRLMAVLVIALVIDIMKPASLGFTVPGMTAEYGVSKSSASLVPFFALAGTVTGSILWGLIADIYGRKASILLSAIMFVGTSICGVMPSLAWNVAMCFMMGAAAGGMLPVTYALLAEMMPSRTRGWSLVLVGGLGAVGGYFGASGASALLEPIFGWRVLWLLNLPTGLSLVLLGALIPESAKFLVAHGRRQEAEKVMRRFGARAHRAAALHATQPRAQLSPARKGSTAKLLALSLTALCYGLINFGLLLWLPADLMARGYSMAVASRLLAESTLLALPTIFIAAFAYSRLSAKWSVVGSILLTAAGLVGVLQLELSENGNPILPITLLIIGSNALIAMLLPYTAESFPLRIRGRSTGTVAACTKAGGLIAQGFAIAALVPAPQMVSLALVAPTLAALVLIMWFGRETRGTDLRDLDPEGTTFAGTGV